MALIWGDAPDIGEVGEVDPQRADEALREARWLEFVAWCKGDRPKSDSEWSTMLWHVGRSMGGNTDPYYGASIGARLLDFAAVEGWDGVLNAIARAYREQRDQPPQEP